MSDDYYKKIFSDNLKYYMSINNKSQIDIINDLKVNKSAISTWCNGTRLPRMDKVDMLAKYFHINRSDLIEDHQHDSSSRPDYSTTATPEEFENIIKKYRSLDQHGKETVDIILDRECNRTTQITELSSQKRIFAYYGKIAAAGISYGFEDIICGTKEYPATDENQNADYTIGVSGDSMKPTFYDGDIVYVAKTYHLDAGDIGIFQKDNGIYIKEVGERGLISHNKGYEILTGDDIKCLGKVIGIAERG